MQVWVYSQLLWHYYLDLSLNHYFFVRADEILPSDKEMSDEQVTKESTRRTIEAGNQQATVQISNAVTSE